MSKWHMVGKPVLEKLTKTIAKKFAEMTPCPGDRPLKEHHEQFLRDEIKAGKFRTFDFASCYCEETKTTYRVNGKHTSTLFTRIYESEGGVVEKLAKVHGYVTEYIAETLEDVADLYSTFDVKSSARTAGDIYLNFAAGDSRFDGVSNMAIKTCVAALASLRWGASASKGDITPAERGHYLMTNVDVVLWYDGIAYPKESSADAKYLRRVAVAAAMIATYRKAPQVATEFWTKVRVADGGERDDPDRALNRFLLTTAPNRGQGAASLKNKATHKEIFDKCIHAWNSYRSGEKNKNLKYYPDVDSPKPR